MAYERKFKIGKPILEVNNISLSFGGVKAITDTSFNVLEHEVRAIIGPNGAGKSSMLNCINGIYKPQQGTVSFRGQQIPNITPNIMAQMGLSRTFQNLALFKRMSVLDNILVGRKLHTKTNFLEVALQLPKVKKEEKLNRDRSEEIISFLEIEDIKDTPVGKLPYGLQKKVELGRALATDSTIILLDEPMAGMNVEEKRDMCRFILKVNDELGTTMVLIEHDMGVVMDISDRVVVLDYGKVIGETIDYGPCAFMDTYDPKTVFSSIDKMGRYAYCNQPAITKWNLSRFAECLIPLIDENENKAVKSAIELIDTFGKRYEEKWLNMMRNKLGLLGEDKKDKFLIVDLLTWMHQNKVDYTNTFCHLMNLKDYDDDVYKDNNFQNWKKNWQERLKLNNNTSENYTKLMRSVNPHVIPRNHKIEESLEKANDGNLKPFNKLLEILKKPYTLQENISDYLKTDNSLKDYKTFCGT